MLPSPVFRPSKEPGLSDRPKRWHVAEPAPPDYIAALSDLPPVLAQVLYNRGYRDPAQARAFLEGRWDGPNDPFLLKGMAEAVQTIRRAIRGRQPIAIYGDYDADGVSATVVLAHALRAIGATGRIHIPHRYEEGYGVNAAALRKLAEQGVRLVITVDCGISSAREVAEAAEYGLQVIITDHHTPGLELPPAAAIINPRQPDCPYPFKDLAGVGLAYKLAQALLQTEDRGWKTEALGPPSSVPRPLSSDDLFDLVALGTVADVVPLRGENRMLVQQGLAQMRRAPRPGLQALLDIADIPPQRITARTLGYILGPRLNASGRLTHARYSLKLLMAETPAEARPLARQLNEWNRQRQHLTLQYTEAARQRVLAEGIAPLLFVASRDFLSGIVGLVASRLLDEFYRPAVVVAIEDGQSKGSARSIPGFHIAEALNACHDLFERHGGHAAAAGFTIRTERLPELQARLRALATAALGDHDVIRPLRIDAEPALADLTERLLANLARLEPCGQDNPPPLFLTRGLRVLDRRYVGRDAAHLQLRLTDGQEERRAVVFNHARITAHVPDRVDVVYQLAWNEWGGQGQVEMHICDLRPAQL